MDLLEIQRPDDAFQKAVPPDRLQAVCRRAFGADTEVLKAVELGGGMYNTTYRLDVAGREEPVVLRIAPEPGLQFHSERELMRNEYASVPWLAPIAPLMPRVLAADWSHEVIGRDWMMQSFLPGTAAPDLLSSYPRDTFPAFFRQMGEITATVHAVRGPHFGPVAGPAYGRWSEAVHASLQDIASDLDNAGLDAADLRKIADIAGHESAVLDEIDEPSLLTGDLWTVNTMLATAAPVPTITGVLDMDRTWWGDPDADWTLRMARAKQDERLAFFDTYGAPASSSAAEFRRQVYEARHLGAIRLERHRLGNAPGVQASYQDMAAILARLG
ncbi:phosphotransferase family protein [Streptomyces sp. NPDC054956]